MKLLNLLFISILVITFLSCDKKDQPSSAPQKTGINNIQTSEVSSYLKVLQDDSADGQVKMNVLIILGNLGDESAVEPVIEILKKDMKERTGLWAAAIDALGNLGDPRAVPILLEALKRREDDWMGREMAARALESIGNTDAVDGLIVAFNFADTRDSAVKALAHIGDERAVEVLIDALDKAEYPDTVESAKKGLLKIGKPALPALQKELKNFSKEYPNEFRRTIIKQLLDKMG